MQKIKMLTAGESPEFGPFVEGDERTVDDELAQVLKARGVCRILSEKNKPEGQKERGKEGKPLLTIQPSDPPAFPNSQEV